MLTLELETVVPEEASPANLAAILSTVGACTLLLGGPWLGLAVLLWGESGVLGGVGGWEPGLLGPAVYLSPRARADSDSRILPKQKNTSF